MLSIAPATRIYLCTEVCDMRKSFDGLMMMTQHVMEHDPLSGHLFVFRNRRGDRIKILYWDTDGLAIWYKRLEAGKFRFPLGPTASISVTAAQLAMILEGIEVKGMRRLKRYEKTM